MHGRCALSSARRTWTFLSWSLGGLLTLFVWLVLPAMRQPIVRVPGSAFALSIACVPQAITLETRANYLQLQSARLLVLDGSGRLPPTVEQLQAMPVDASGGNGFLLSLSATQQSEASLAVTSLGKHAQVRLSAEFARVPSLDVRSVRIQTSRNPSNSACGRTELNGDSLVSRITTAHPEILPAFFPQEEISDFVLKINQVGGALSIGALLLTLLWLLWQWTLGLWELFLVPSNEIKARIAGRLAQKTRIFSAKNEIEVIRGEFELIHRRLSFARVLGPAVGFLLTVSSLVAGLHPSLQSANNNFQLVSSLQLALIATFVGLLIRIVAEFAIRVHTGASERALLLCRGP